MDPFMTLRAMVDDMYRRFKKKKEEDEPKDEEGEASHSENPKIEGPSRSGKKIENDDVKRVPFSSLLGGQPESSSPKKLLESEVKIDLPMYNGEINAEKIDNRIRQMEVYCNVQHIYDDVVKIRLASLCLQGTTLIRWRSKLQHGTQ